MKWNECETYTMNKKKICRNRPLLKYTNIDRKTNENMWAQKWRGAERELALTVTLEIGLEIGVGSVCVYYSMQSQCFIECAPIIKNYKLAIVSGQISIRHENENSLKRWKQINDRLNMQLNGPIAVDICHTESFHHFIRKFTNEFSPCTFSHVYLSWWIRIWDLFFSLRFFMNSIDSKAIVLFDHCGLMKPPKTAMKDTIFIYRYEWLPRSR